MAIKNDSMHIQTTMINGNKKLISWIPSKYAIIGNYLQLLDNDKSWNNGWKVISIGHILPTKTVMRNSQDYKRTRKASDI